MLALKKGCCRFAPECCCGGRRLRGADRWQPGSAAGAATEITLTAEQTAAVDEISNFINGFKTLAG